MVLAFSCTPVRKENLGLGSTIIENYTLDREEAKNLRDYFDALEAGQSVSDAVVLSIIGGSIFAGIAGVIFGVVASVAVGIATEYFQTLDNDLDVLATSTNDINDVELTYKYIRHGSSSGAYHLDSVKVISMPPY
ncbi:hypothetical protein [Sedimentibacter sp.]|uniref:hypothetical protein n=1 Tax=Sedimentibacter sp. TaxID=1960295 RepID=UPI0028A28FEA|nr:hypothetical protein [Sedimentibacter sp.]